MSAVASTMEFTPFRFAQSDSGHTQIILTNGDEDIAAYTIEPDGYTYKVADRTGKKVARFDTQVEAYQYLFMNYVYGQCGWPHVPPGVQLIETGSTPAAGSPTPVLRYMKGWEVLEQPVYLEDTKLARAYEGIKLDCVFLRIARMLTLTPGDAVHLRALFCAVLAYFRHTSEESMQTVLEKSEFWTSADARDGYYFFTETARVAIDNDVMPVEEGQGVSASALRVSDVYMFERQFGDHAFTILIDPSNRLTDIVADGEPMKGTETLHMLRNLGVRNLEIAQSTTGVLNWIIDGGNYRWERYARY